MSDKERFFAEPVAYIITLFCVGFFVLSLAFVLGLVILPIAGVAAGGYYAFRYWQMQKLRVYLPDPKSAPIFVPESAPGLSPRYDPDKFAQKLHGKVLAYIEKDTGRVSCKALSDAFTNVVTQLYADESFHDPPAPPESQDLISRAAYHDKLEAWRKRTDDATASDLFLENLAFAYMELRQFFPNSAFQDTTESQLTVPISIEMEPEQVESFAAWFFQKDVLEYQLYEKLREQIVANTVAVEEHKGKVTFDSIFAGTPIAAFSEVKIPFDVPLSKQLEHSMIAAGSRYGKSQLIGSIISTHLQSENPPGIIVIDSTGDFQEKISRLNVFAPGGRLAGRLLIIDPAQAPQLNMFDISNLAEKRYSVEDMEQVEAATLNLFSYVFASVGSELTSQQGTGFNFLVRLLLSMPGSNLGTLKDILEIPAKTYGEAPQHIRTAIERLDPTTQTYFKNQFFSQSMVPTRQGVARRLYNILQIPTFERMFSGANRIDFFKAMNDGMIIVVNTSKARLQETASALFGRYIIARVMSAAFERTVIKDMNKRRPCLLIVDEAQEYFDTSIDTMLTQIGKYKLGLCIAFQYFAQLDDKLRTSVIGNTTVKYAGGLGASEARLIAREMRVDDAFIMAQRKDSHDPPQWAQFATHINYMTERAVSITVPFYALENMPKMTPAEHSALLERNRASVTSRAKAAVEPTTAPAPAHASESTPTSAEKTLSPPTASEQRLDDDAASKWA
jgi:hypothetical protein